MSTVPLELTHRSEIPSSSDPGLIFLFKQTSLMTSQIDDPWLGGRLTRVWQVQEAKARFSEMLESSVSEGPQLVTKRGVEAAVLVSVDHWRRLQKLARRNLKELLLAPEARTEELILRRQEHRHRALPPLE